MIRIENITKDYEGVRALDGVSLTMEEHETTVLIGPSGCGKSTLIRIITGLTTPDSGSVIVEGSKLTQENKIAIRRNLGYVIQDGGLFPHLTAHGNITLMSNFLKYDSAKTASRVEELRVLTSFPKEGMHKFPVQLSGGQKQRVSLMRALMLDPGILLLDEPLGALDPLIRYDLQTDLKEIFAKLKKTVVLVTHDLAEATYFADKIVLMKDGRIVQQGKPDDLFNKPANEFVKQFVNAQRSHLV